MTLGSVESLARPRVVAGAGDIEHRNARASRANGFGEGLLSECFRARRARGAWPMLQADLGVPWLNYSAMHILKAIECRGRRRFPL